MYCNIYPFAKAVSRKPRKLFGPGKPLLVNLYLKTERCIQLKIFVWTEPRFVHIKNMWIKQLCDKRLENLLWLSGEEMFSGPSRNAARDRSQIRRNWHEDRSHDLLHATSSHWPSAWWPRYHAHLPDFRHGRLTPNRSFLVRDSLAYQALLVSPSSW